jgi:N6-L-threonylcarbamoyladenine synthase
MDLSDIDGVAVTALPGLMGSLLVGLSYAKALAWSLDIPFVTVNHMEAHLYAPHLEYKIEYPYLGLIVSGGHTLICHVHDQYNMEVMGTTVDDACGEAFDKVAKFYKLGYPGGVAIDKLARKGDPKAFHFPKARLNKGDNPYNMSYSGLKTAVINQLNQFKKDGAEATHENIAASFQRIAIDMLIDRVKIALDERQLDQVVAGGGVSANSYLRKRLTSIKGCKAYFPSMELCTDNGAMIAGLGYHHIKNDHLSDLRSNAQARVMAFKHKYP